MIQHITNIPEDWVIPTERFNNIVDIDSRCNAVDERLNGNFRSVLKYLYVDPENGGISSISPAVKKRVIENKLLEETEAVLFKSLFTRSNGANKKEYGPGALLAARNARYKCEDCNNPDIRTHCIDHMWREGSLIGFQLLCHNCHAIKSRKEDWTGDKKGRDKIEGVRILKLGM
jgi:hypothetical protein